MSELEAHVCVMQYDFQCLWSRCPACGRTETDERLAGGTVVLA